MVVELHAERVFLKVLVDSQGQSMFFPDHSDRSYWKLRQIFLHFLQFASTQLNSSLVLSYSSPTIIFATLPARKIQLLAEAEAEYWAR